jgi:hypothetical protein
MTSTKLQRQSSTVRSTVPATGSAAGTMALIIEMAAMPRTASCSGSVARMTVGETTVAAPAAMPCTKRSSSNGLMEGGTVQLKLAATSVHTPMRTHERGPMRCSASPHTSCQAARPASNMATVS